MTKTSVAAALAAVLASAALVGSAAYASPAGADARPSASALVCRCAPVGDTWCNGKTCWPAADGIAYRPASAGS